MLALTFAQVFTNSSLNALRTRFLCWYICKQFGQRPGPTICRAWSESKLFETLMVLLKEIFENVDLKQKSADDKSAWSM